MQKYFSARDLPYRKGRPPVGPVETREQHVYIMSVPSGHFKVGIAKNPASRRALLQCGNPEQISIVGSSQVSPSGVCARKFEQIIHDTLRPWRSRNGGEWYETDHIQIYTAYKFAWTVLVRPHLIERYLRLRLRRRQRPV